MAIKLGTRFAPNPYRLRAEEIRDDAHALFGATLSSPLITIHVEHSSRALYFHHHPQTPRTG